MEHHIEINEMMEKDKKAFDNISVAMPAGFEEAVSSSPTLMELRDELLMDHFPVNMPRKGWTEAEWAVVPSEMVRALCAMELAHVRAHPCCLVSHCNCVVASTYTQHQLI